LTAAIGAEGIFSKPGAALGPAGFGMRRKFWGERIAPRQLSRRAGDGSALSVVVRREAPDVVSTQSARGRASYRCPIVGAAPPPRSAPDVVSTQSARGRASYRCPVVGAAPSPRSAPDVVSTQSARGRASYRCPIVGAAPPPRSAPDVVSTQSARGRASYRCPVVGAAPPPRSAPDVVLTQSARGRVSYRCPIVGAAPPPRSAPDVVLTQSARGRASYRCPSQGRRHCGSGALAAIFERCANAGGACGHATAMAVRLSGAAKPCIGRVHALNAWALIASRPERGCNAPKRCCKESVIPILPYPAGCIIQATCPRAC
jgi:hypothetical protein